MAKRMQTATAILHLVHWKPCPSVTQLCPLGTGTEVPDMLGGEGCSLDSFTIPGLPLLDFFPGDVCTEHASLDDSPLERVYKQGFRSHE